MYTDTVSSSISIEVGLPSASRRVTEKRKRFLELLLEQAAEAVKTMQPQTLDYFSDQLRQKSSPTEERDTKFVAAVTGGKTYAPAESAVIQASALLSSYNLRRTLLSDALSTNDVARILSVSRQTPNDRAKAGTLLGVQENGTLRFPAWQFDAEEENGTLPGLPDVLRALDTSPLGKVSWLTRPNRDLNGERPVDLLKRRKVDAVLTAARLIGTY